MPLTDNFVFSAHNLQDYLECPRRFELKNILKQGWPAITSQPVLEMENKIQMGNRFHQLAHQYLSGISVNVLEETIDDPDLGLWFKRFQIYINSFLNFPYFSEFTVLIPFEGFRLIAVFDFITLINSNKILICDWKTTSHLPKKEVYSQSIQSNLYTFIAFETRVNIFPQSLAYLHQDLSMEYWFPDFPENTITREHSESVHAISKEILSNLIIEISNKVDGTFEKTANTKRCAFCQYRSLCEREIQAGRNDDLENWSESDLLNDTLDFDQIEEIPF